MTLNNQHKLEFHPVMPLGKLWAFSVLSILFFTSIIWSSQAVSAAQAQRHRVIVSTDIGGTDPDDFQSMVHLLLYADTLDIEGIISSAFGPGRKKDILTVITHYEQDYPTLKTYADTYPTPDALRAITKQGSTEAAPYQGFTSPTEGSDWIIKAARKDDPRPLHILVWGGLEDVAQALHDAPDILPKIRVYFIGGPNKKWSPDAYSYLAEHHKDLWIIETNASYRGWFEGGNQQGEWSNQAFVTQHIADKGSLGRFFATQLGGTIKMGDSPSVGWLLNGTPSDPSQPGWGGRFVKAWPRTYKVFDRLTTEHDTLEIFGIFELILPTSGAAPNAVWARMVIENQSLVGFLDGAGKIHFRFSPKSAKIYSYTLESNDSALNGSTGLLTSLPLAPSASQHPDSQLPAWWTDDPSRLWAEGEHAGARTVNRWRQAFLTDFAKRMMRCKVPASSHTAQTHKE